MRVFPLALPEKQGSALCTQCFSARFQVWRAAFSSIRVLQCRSTVRCPALLYGGFNTYPLRGGTPANRAHLQSFVSWNLRRISNTVREGRGQLCYPNCPSNAFLGASTQNQHLPTMWLSRTATTGLHFFMLRQVWVHGVHVRRPSCLKATAFD